MQETPTIPQREELAMRIRASIRAQAMQEAQLMAGVSKQMKRLASSSTKYRPGFARGNGMVFSACARMQRSSVIVRYTGNRLPGSWRAHGHYQRWLPKFGQYAKVENHL